MIHGARTLFSLIELDQRLEDNFRRGQKKRERLREIMMFHSRFCAFLEDHDHDNNVRALRDLCIKCFEDCFPSVNWSSFLKAFGNLLSLHKEAREAETYEHFVVAHHGRKYHFESPFIETLFQKSEEDANRCIPEILSYILKFYESQIPMRSYHLWHLKDELKWLEKTLDKEKVHMSSEMIAFLHSLKNLVKNVDMPADYLNFEREMDMNYYTYKGEVYGKLRNLAEELTGQPVMR